MDSYRESVGTASDHAVSPEEDEESRLLAAYFLSLLPLVKERSAQAGALVALTVDALSPGERREAPVLPGGGDRVSLVNALSHGLGDLEPRTGAWLWVTMAIDILDGRSVAGAGTS